MTATLNPFLRPAAGIMVLALCSSGVAQEKTVTEDGIIAGTMNIDFPTRYRVDSSGAPQKGVKDSYTFNFNVARTTEFAGTISRVPKLSKDGLLGEKETQGNQLEFDIDLTVIHPSDPTQRKAVGKWVGVVPINDNGEYQIEGSSASPHRVAIEAIGKAQAFTEKFGGTLAGKPKVKKENKAISFVRRVAGKEVKIQVTNSDPMRFNGIQLPAGPAQIYPRTIVNGNLDYDYDTGNWYTSGIRMKYNVNGVDTEDIITGSIKWVEDAARESNGKGRYELNLRFNEEKNQSASTEADAFEGMSDEEAFFAVDNSIPALTGTIEYVDSFDGSGDRVTQSKVTYNLNANKLTKQQVVNFFKLWMLGVGPINDE